LQNRSKRLSTAQNGPQAAQKEPQNTDESHSDFLSDKLLDDRSCGQVRLEGGLPFTNQCRSVTLAWLARRSRSEEACIEPRAGDHRDRLSEPCTRAVVHVSLS